MKKSFIRIPSPALRNPLRLLFDVAMAFLAYIVCQLAFVFENHELISGSLTLRKSIAFLAGGLHFDASAICYTNGVFILLFIAAFFFRRVPLWYGMVLRLLFVVVNGLCVGVNLADSVFFGYRLKRTTASIFSEFGGDGNVAAIVGHEVVGHWYFVVLAALVIVCMWKFFRGPVNVLEKGGGYYPVSVIISLVLLFFCICGMRGVVTFRLIKGPHPIGVNYAFRYTDNPIETGVVLNTPFTILRTLGKSALSVPEFYITEKELDSVYNPVHEPAETMGPARKKNIVVIILESFSRGFVGGLSPEEIKPGKGSLTPNIDAMLDSCMWFDEMIANTAFSIDACPAVLASIPRGDTPFVLSGYSVNKINSLASELDGFGYETAYFMGAQNQSMGICDFISQAGFRSYYGLDEYLADEETGGMKDYDGLWGIWDEPYLQYFCRKLGDMRQPFLGTLFTLSSHHPFNVPDEYRDVFKDEGGFEVEKCIRYTDHALGRFFEEARKQPWFGNTIFVMTADHTEHLSTNSRQDDKMVNYRIPILIYDPSGELPRGRQRGIIQQIDIMPTLLDLVGYDRPYVSFGKNVLKCEPGDRWAFNWCFQPCLFRGEYVMTSDGEKVTGLYNYVSDRGWKENLLGKGLEAEPGMDRKIKAILQSYVGRMNGNRLTTDAK